MNTNAIPYQRSRRGDKALIFIHGFLDAGELWESTIDHVSCPGYEVVTFDLPGMGALSSWEGQLTLDTLSAAVISVVDTVGKPCVLVGHSMGTQLAELAAAARPELVKGLVLISPIPLAGLPVDQQTIDIMHALGQNRDLQLAVRKQFSPELSEEQLEAHMQVGLKPTREACAALFDAWSQGDPRGNEPSAFQGPVRVVTGSNDPFAAPPIVEAGIQPRFGQFSMRVLDGANHWAHLTMGSIMGEEINQFVEKNFG